MKIDSPTFLTETTFISASVQFSSGSQKFGNTSDDIHQFTGSVSFGGPVTASSNISGSSTSTGSFGAVAIGKATADNQRALTVVGNAQFDNNAQIYFKRSSGTADPYISYDSSDNFNIFNPVAGEIRFAVGSGYILDIESTGINFNGSKSLTTSTGAGVITVNGNSGVILKSGTGGGSGPIQFMQGSTVVSEVTTTHAISGSSTSTGSFGRVESSTSNVSDNAFIGNRLGIGLATTPSQPLHIKINNSNSDPHFFIENTNASGRSHARFWNSSRNTYWSFGQDNDNLTKEAGDVMCMIQLLIEKDLVNQAELNKRIVEKREKLKDENEKNNSSKKE